MFCRPKSRAEATGENELYNLAQDIGERDNLATTMSDKAMELRKVLTEWRDRVRGEVPPDSTADPAQSMSGSDPMRHDTFYEGIV